MRKFTNDSEFCGTQNSVINFYNWRLYHNSLTYNLKNNPELENFKIVAMAKPGCYLWRLGQEDVMKVTILKRKKKF